MKQQHLLRSICPGIVGVVTVALALLVPAVAAQPDKVSVLVDPRVELVAVAQMLSGYTDNPRFKGRINEFDHPYLNELRRHVAPFKGHPALQRLAALRIGGSDPMSIAVQMTAPDAVVLADQLEGVMVQREAAEAYVSCLRELAEAARFAAFSESLLEPREAIVADFRRTVDVAAVVERLEVYCGMGNRRYVVVLAPLLGRTGFGPSARAADGRAVCYAILPAQRVADGHLVFGESDALAGALSHEFGHPYLGQLEEKYWSELEGFAALMAKVQYGSSSNYGRGWRTFVEESVLRAVVARITLQQKGEGAYAEQLERDRRSGFVLGDDLTRALASYEEKRDLYPDLGSYFPELVQVFASRCRANQGAE